ncbi:MAG TPA: hypothetical protein VGK03_01720 [Geothrix sp.]|jgi:pimeloyl-ACP methyl ester carboxylesterase
MTALKVGLLLALVAVFIGCNHKKFPTAPERFSSENGNVNHLVNIQFNDHGDLWDEGSYKGAMNLIQETRAQSPTGRVVVVTYVHGWRHNAAEDDTDYGHFRNLIHHTAQAADRKSPVIGIYIGWRGSSFQVPVLEYLTFWSRHGAAKRVAGTRMSEVISQLMHATKGGSGTSRFIIIGHSFGGRVVETVLAQSMVSVLVDNGTGPGLDPKAPFDLAILLNTASEARQTFQFIEALNSIGFVGAAGDDPLVLGITSRRDWATSAAFPAGRFAPVFLSALFGGMRSDRDAQEPGSILAARSNGESYPGQIHQSMWTAGHMWFMRSHELVEDERDRNRVLIRPLRLGSDGKPAQSWNDTPYWVVHEPTGNIIQGHNDIWRDPRLVTCLQGYIAGALKARETPRKLILRASPKRWQHLQR